ncbi:hypothetical protein SAMN05660197_1257 [Nitratiruptor tergarcus DSM 16512]|uniref:Uncharacterized protein n=1 Tax=Nitratiruptor tergarcus DSM 16512 TaxID=1069081 RepID=A0A1W1WTB9_9BACT|nr:hypothetical protein SAMN05660197_1257 [Nitratiruptor tergarcus DSM 16512]
MGIETVGYIFFTLLMVILIGIKIILFGGKK